MYGTINILLKITSEQTEFNISLHTVGNSLVDVILPAEN